MAQIEWRYRKWGAVWIVYWTSDHITNVMHYEDSRWDSEADAKRHCELLNKQYKEDRFFIVK